MALPVDFEAAQALEHSLGDVTQASNTAGWAQAVHHDELEAYPLPFVTRLRAHGFLESFIATETGRLESLPRAAMMLRAVARRDLTTAIALGQCFLGSVPVWVAGTAAQRARQAAGLRSGQSACLALTEEAHGSDLLATETRATPEAGAWRLKGRKWLINNATLGTLLTVLARTREEGGLGGFSLFQVDKDALPPGSFQPIPKLRTHGIRGADISGIDFDALLPAGAVLGREGGGLDLTLKALQVTRIGCAAFSLGSADSALRLTLDFARSRRLYGGTVFDVPQVRTALAGAFVELLIADAVSLGAMRGLHSTPGQMSLASAVVKYLVPTRLEAAVRELAVVLGARHYVREGHGHGFFQKLMRDMAVVSLFDGSTAVNLEAIALQRPRLRPSRSGDGEQRLSRRFNPGAPLEAFDGSGLELMALEDEVLEGFAAAVEAFDGPNREDVRRHGATLLAQYQEDGAQFAALGPGRRRSTEAFRLAARAAAHYAAASCLRLWAHGRRALGGVVESGEWVAPALARLIDPACAVEGGLVEALTARHDRKAWLGLAEIVT